MSTYRTEGIILKRSHFGEANLLLHVYTRDFGKIEMVARSARKSYGKLKGHLEPFLHCDFVVARGRKMDTVANSFILKNFLDLRGDLEKTLCAFTILEITERMSADGYRDERIFCLLQKSLDFLNRISCNQADFLLLILFFEVNILSLSGIRPQVKKCVFCGEKIVPGENRFSYSLGGVLHSNCFSNCPDAIFINDNAIKLIKFLEVGEGADSYDNLIEDKLLCLSKIKLEKELMFQNIFLLRDFIFFNIDKKINSFDFLYNLASK